MNDKTTMNNKLGKGFSALFNDNKEETKDQLKGYTDLDIDAIIINSHQPRTHFDDEKIKELAKSISENGLLQPLTVVKKNNGYELVAGERRLRACKSLGWLKVPVIIMENVTEEKKSILAVIENLQRENLNCLELARAYTRIIKDYNLTQEQLSDKLGINRSELANYVRILKLPEKVTKYVENNRLSFGHAKILAGIKDEETQIELATKVVQQDLTVKKLTDLVKQKQEETKKEELTPDQKSNDTDPNTSLKTDNEFQSFQTAIKEKLGINAEFKGEKKNGKIILSYTSEEQLEKVIALLNSTTDLNK